MLTGSICLLVVLTIIICKVLTGAAKVVALIALGCGVLCMAIDSGNLEKATQDIKKLKETKDEKTE